MAERDDSLGAVMKGGSGLAGPVTAAGRAAMRINDAVFGVVLLLAAARHLRGRRGFPAMPGQDFGPALFPT